MTTTTKYSKANQERINTWFKQIPNINNEVDVIKHHDDVYKWIKKKYTNINTLKSHLSTLAVVFRETKANNTAYKKYSAEATKLNEQSVETAKKGGLVAGRDFVPWDSLVNTRTRLKKQYDKDKTNVHNNLLHLLVCLYTLQPPLRTEYKDMQIITDKAQNDGKTNFLLMEKTKGALLINKDKVVKTYGKANIEITPELFAVLNDSIKSFPRTYVLSSPDGKQPIKKGGFDKLMEETFFPLKVTVDVLRCSYVTHIYNDSVCTPAIKETLATQMRTSVANSEVQYNKALYHKKIVECPKCHFKFELK